MKRAADQVVTSNANSGAGTLRQAISDVTTGGTITFNLPAGNETVTIASQLVINKALTIDGANTAGSGVAVTVKVTTPGTSPWRVFTINASGFTINIQNMTMLGGSTGGSYGGVMTIGSGTTVYLTGITMSNGKSTYGGGVYLTGINAKLYVSNSTLSNNSATSMHGGWCYNDQCSVTVSTSTFSGNTAVNGGGIYNSIGSCYLLNSIIINNTSPSGADLYNTGGSMYAYYSWYNGTSGTISTQATAPNVTTAYVSGDLGALANNGGSTKTMAVSSASAAPDNGTFVYYNATDGYYFLDNQASPVSHKLIAWATSPTVIPSNNITTDQRTVTIGNPPTIGAYYLIPVHVASTGGTSSADYYTLKEAVDAINAGTHQGAITITLNGRTVETASVVFNASGSGSASYTSVNIYPTATGLSISGNLATPLIDLDGADNVTLDGRVNAAGSSKDLVITNTGTSSTSGTSTIRFINDACSNTPLVFKRQFYPIPAVL